MKTWSLLHRKLFNILRFELLLCIFFFTLPIFATTTITGTVADQQGNSLNNGRVIFALITPNQESVQQISTGKIIPPGSRFTIQLNSSGQIPASQQLVGQDDIVQSGTYYTESFFNSKNQQVSYQTVTIKGSTEDLTAFTIYNPWPPVTLYLWPTQEQLPY
ncbi:MAG: hypothetical protein KGN01_06245 [Patescibacteria group bacterium]|nr:hypothetical protein [Patescibacteria group bacterium]